MTHHNRYSLLLAAALPACSLLVEFPECEEDLDCGAAQICVAFACAALDGPEVVEVTEDIRADSEWTADKIYLLRNPVYVHPQATLTIRAGTTIRGVSGSALIVRNGGRLDARGNPQQPVVFTSDRPEGERLPGDWGGVSLLGKARVNEPAAALEGLNDASLATYGGDDDAWSCGTLEYVRIEFAGYALKKDEELNGLTLAGCGSGTIVDHVQVHLGKDDGVEVFGGAVDLRHVLISRAQDDSLDWDRGWRGTAQFIAVTQDEAGDNAIEGDNWKDLPDAAPRSAPVLYNLTLVSAGKGSQRGLTLKAGTAGSIHNAVIVGQGKEAVDIQGAESAMQLMGGGLRIEHSLFYAIGVGGEHYFPTLEDEAEIVPGDGRDDDAGFDEDEYLRRVERGNLFGVDPQLVDRLSLSAPDLRARGPVDEVGITPPPGFDEGASYAGAFAPGEPAWTDGWTAFPAN